MKRRSKNDSSQRINASSATRSLLEQKVTLLTKIVFAVIALGYLYGFVIIWSAFGAIGVTPFWFPIHLFLPTGLCFLLVIVVFTMVGITLGGEEIKLFSRAHWKNQIDYAVGFSVMFTVTEILLFNPSSYFRAQKPSLHGVFLVLFPVLFWFWHRAWDIGYDKLSRVLGLIGLAVVVVFHVVNRNDTMVSYFMICFLVSVVGMLYFTPNVRDVNAKRTVSEKLQSPIWLTAAAVALVGLAVIFGNTLYFRTKQEIGGGDYKCSLFILNKSIEERDKMDAASFGDSILSNRIQSGRIEGYLLGHTSDSYYIKIKTPNSRHKSIAIKHDLVEFVLFDYSPETLSPNDAHVHRNHRDSTSE